MAGRILVPLDGSELSEQALPVAQRLARCMDGCQIELFFAISPRLADSGDPEALASERSWAIDYLNSRAEALAAQGVKSEVTVSIGPPARCILQRLKKEAFDFVVMATHGRSGLARAVIGSVTDLVLRQSPVPTVVVQSAMPRAVAAGIEAAPTERLIELFARRDVLANAALAEVVKRGAAALDPLTAALTQRDPGVRQMAARALGHIGDTRTEPALVRALADDDFDVRWEAEEALPRFGDWAILQVLSAITQRPLDRRLSASYAHVLDRAPIQFHDVLKPVLAALQSSEFHIRAPLAASRAVADLKPLPVSSRR